MDCLADKRSLMRWRGWSEERHEQALTCNIVVILLRSLRKFTLRCSGGLSCAAHLAGEKIRTIGRRVFIAAPIWSRNALAAVDSTYWGRSIAGAAARRLKTLRSRSRS